RTPPWLFSFGTRPEVHIQAAWLCGLALLESGRLEARNWKLFAGAFFLTWASGVHYYAVASAVGLAVYLLVVLESKNARRAQLAICAGAALFGIPYLLFYLLPYWSDIWRAIRATQGSGGMAVSIRTHFELYRAWAHSPFQDGLVRMGTSLGVPL